MFPQSKFAPDYFGLIRYCVLSIVLIVATASNAHAQDTTNVSAPATTTSDTLRFPIRDRRADFISAKPSVYDFRLPSNITDSIVYDPVTKNYIVYEKIGSRYFRTPTYYTAEEFRELEARRSEQDYFKQRANTL